MLVRNLTKVTLNVGYGTERIHLEPMKITVVDECKYSAEYLKKLYGPHIQIMTEKVAVTNEPKTPKETTGEVVTKKDVKGDVANKPVDNTGDVDTDAPKVDEDIDKLIDEVHEELEGEDTGVKEAADEGKEETPKADKETTKKAPAKTAKKSTKKKQ